MAGGRASGEAGGGALVRRLAGILLLVSVAAVLAGDARIALAAATCAVCSAWILDRTALRTALGVAVCLAMFFAAAIAAAAVAWSAGPVRGFETGGMVLLRLVVLAVAAGVLVRAVDAELVLRLAERLGMERLGLVLGLSLNALPRIGEASLEVWAAHSARGRSLGDRLRRLPDLGEVLLAHTARIAEEATAAAALRGHSALTRAHPPLPLAIPTVVLTGPSGGGKTEAVLELVGRLGARGVPVRGFVQVAIREEGRKVGFRIRDLVSGEETELATWVGRERGQFGTGFLFHEDGFSLGRRALERTVPGSVVIIDEIGPVELRGAGHMPAVRRALARPGLIGAVLVVRRALVPSLLAAIDASDAKVFDLEETTGAAIAMEAYLSNGQ